MTLKILEEFKITEGTSQGLFIVVAIVIFGIFVSLSYTLFGKTLQPQVVALFESGVDVANESLLNNKNLIEEFDMKVTTAGVKVLERKDSDIHFSSTGTDFAGIVVNSNSLKPNKKYSLNYTLEKESGSITRIGGHISIATEFDMYINDVLQKVPDDKPTTVNSYSYGVPYDMKDGEKINVRIDFLTDRYDKSQYPDRPLKIQPNRFHNSSADTGFKTPYSAKITNLNLKIVN